ncbi:hypothetical protein HK099_005072 [Clydaea vesicula]|uniref:Uncharacterized protein n=1 Tax=Clydaea vesicula TaxID=447962 RepID=A0AAD5TZL7_9FUNG|nr:hypothetical protein HK099_005072 [Clydaea vesicula]KAJ3394617.1 hypothetical protein HDU92_006722 [Lobulomyces angularis]
MSTTLTHKIRFDQNFPSVITSNQPFKINFEVQFPSWETTSYRHLDFSGLYQARRDIYHLFITLVDEQNNHLRHLFFKEMFCYNGNFGYSKENEDQKGQPNEFYLPSYTINPKNDKFRIKVSLVNQDKWFTSFTEVSKTFSLQVSNNPVLEDSIFRKLGDGNHSEEVSIFTSMWSCMDSAEPEMQEIVQTVRNGDVVNTSTLEFALKSSN